MEVVMSRRFPVAMALGGLVLAGAASARAQGEESLRAQIPFEFKVGSATLPAGEYRVEYDPAETQSMLDVSSMDGHHQAIALTEGVIARKGAPNSNRLVFEK